jgi:hypothetical protein
MGVAGTGVDTGWPSASQPKSCVTSCSPGASTSSRFACAIKLAEAGDVQRPAPSIVVFDGSLLSIVRQ